MTTPTPETNAARLTDFYEPRINIFHTPASLEAFARRAKGDAALTDEARAKVVANIERKKVA